VLNALRHGPGALRGSPVQLLARVIPDQVGITMIEIEEIVNQLFPGSSYLCHLEFSQSADQKLALIDHFGWQMSVQQNEKLLVADDFFFPSRAVDFL
jgi:hypothetical protein